MRPSGHSSSSTRPDYADRLRRDIFPRVQKPARYIGGEWNQIDKEPGRVSSRVVLAFPDVYEIGVSYLGFQILYEVLNEREEVYAERVFSPWPDLEAVLREQAVPLCSLETSTPLSAFHVLGVTLQHELSYTNVLTLLDLGGVPVRSRDRGEGHPLVLGGGPCASNPEPLAEVFDALVLGDGERAFLEVIEAEQALRQRPRVERLAALARLEGVYVPSRYRPVYSASGRFERVDREPGTPATVRRRVEPPPELPRRPLVPYLGVTHDRVSAEIVRGCTRGCRFCQAGIIHRPVRERDPETVLRQVLRAVAETGYEEASLTALSSGDYTQLVPLVRHLMNEFRPHRIALSFPSLRLDSFRRELAETVREVRKTGLTFAPEAGSDRLRRVINKCLEEDTLLASLAEVFAEGWDLVKLYFMVGLPTETREDISAIAALVRRVLAAGRAASGGSRSPRVNLSINLFVPKPHTPFQWEPQLPREDAAARFRQLAAELPKAAGFRFGAQGERELEKSYLEGLLARGDRRLFPLVLRVWELGARFDSWGDQFRPDLWTQAAAETGLSLDDLAGRIPDVGSPLPWGHLDMGVTEDFLRTERERALRGEVTMDCRARGACQGCGVGDPAACPPPPAPTLPPSDAPQPVAPAPERESVRLRLRYRKTGDLRFVGHLDLVNLFRRAARRARLPLHYSRGFHPQPALSFGPPLPLGFAGLDEWVDLGLDRWEDPGAVVAALNQALPPGLRVEAGREVPLSAPALSELIQAGDYTAEWPLAPDRLVELDARLNAFLEARDVPGRQWSKRQGETTVNLRAPVRRLERVDAGPGIAAVRFVHATLPQGTAKVPVLVEYWSRDMVPYGSVRVTRTLSGRLVGDAVRNP